MRKLIATTSRGHLAILVVERRTSQWAKHPKTMTGDKSHNAKFQDASKTINIIFRGDRDFGSTGDQKLLLWEIMSVEPVVPQPLRWSEVPILFSRDN
jgi:hypothetical protein